MGDEKSVLRLGGLGGLLAGILAIAAFAVLAAFLLPQPADPDEVVMTYPDFRAGIAVGFGLNMVALILGVTLFLALYRALRGTGPASALYGSVIGVLGSAVLAVGVSSQFVAYAPLYDLYVEAATDAERTTVVLLWQATLGAFGTFFGVGNLFLSIALIPLGAAMLRASDFGKGFGGVSMALGVAGVAGVTWVAVGLVVPALSLGTPGTMVVPALAYVIFLLLMGGKVYSLSRVPGEG